MKPVRNTVFLFYINLAIYIFKQFLYFFFFKVFETLFIRSRQQFYRL